MREDEWSISHRGLKSIGDGEEVLVGPVRRLHSALFISIRER